MRKQRLLNKIKKHGYSRVKYNKPKQMYIRFNVTPYRSPILLAAAKSMMVLQITGILSLKDMKNVEIRRISIERKTCRINSRNG